MRIALATAGSRGDTQPCLVLARGLMAAGHDVSVFGAPDFAPWAESLKVPYIPVGQNMQNWMTSVADIIHSPWRLPSRLIRELRNECVTQFETLPRLIGEPDIIIGASLMIAGISVAEKRGLPYRHIAYCPQTMPSRTHPPPMIPWQHSSRLANRAYWKMQDAAFNFILRRTLNEQRRKMELPRVPDVYEHVVNKGLLLACDTELAPCPDDAPVEVEQTGSWPLTEDDATLPDAVEDFLARGDPPVYVGFGSMTDADPERTTQTLIGAAQLLNARMLVSVGWAKLGAQSLPSNVCLIGTVSHSALFPRTAAVVHHGGAGTTTAAARAGVPQLLMPHLLDQFYWGHTIHTRGLGPKPLPRNRLTAARLAEALEPCLTDHAMRARCRQTGEQIRATRGVDNAVRYIENLAGVTKR